MIIMKRMISFLLASCISIFMILGCGNEPNQKGTSSEKSDLKQTDVKKNDLPELPRINENETIFIYDRIEKALKICGEPSKKLVFNSKYFNAYNIKYNTNKVLANPDTVSYEFARKGIWITTDISGTIKKIGWMHELSSNSYPIVKFGGRRLKDDKEIVVITSDFNVDQVIQVYGKPLRRAYSGPLRYSDHPDGVVGNGAFLVFNNTVLTFIHGKLAMVEPSTSYFQIDRPGIGIRKAPSSNSPIIRELKLNEIAYETGYIHDTEFHEIVLENGEGPFYVKRGLLKNGKARIFDAVWGNTKNLNNSISKTQSNVQPTTQNLDSTLEKFESYEGKRTGGYITGTDVNLREKPTTNSKVLGVLNNNEPVHVLGKQGNWYWIRRVEPDQRGWVYGKYLN